MSVVRETTARRLAEEALRRPDVEALEGHLRDHLAALTESGLSDEEAFLVAVMIASIGGMPPSTISSNSSTTTPLPGLCIFQLMSLRNSKPACTRAKLSCTHSWSTIRVPAASVVSCAHFRTSM